MGGVLLQCARMITGWLSSDFATLVFFLGLPGVYGLVPVLIRYGGYVRFQVEAAWKSKKLAYLY